MGPRRNDRDDDALLLAAGAGDADAFRVFYRNHVAAVIGFLLRRCGDAETAAELAGETFAAALIACPRYRPGAAPARDWLLRIALRALGEHRRSGRVPTAARRQLAMQRIALTEQDLRRVEQLALLDPDAAILHAVDELEETQRAAVIARVVEEREWADVAAELACSEAAARTHVSSGLAQLRRRLAGGTA
ncbi:sigma-70 family RNA polymerase sigma factor [Conexibacter stalactiti]|uniref:Sigma-70 family RNA polymerase sigma factor n=1 Tax=Conexibacter stalactiti TaxID=1940611 RepID=A0ABU4HSV8_9ACTN|nr:sigma-70 family RNA polymerase sigma factor [Conexibacter stalactiti]MDW5596381.1 sigma-70 family RNA polymerase sigma factor [Conexibacter stalactiti]MEC5037023.1 sigma-70 family RNA polymerase sigma factor [Conexibacter stalactiti]